MDALTIGRLDRMEQTLDSLAEPLPYAANGSLRADIASLRFLLADALDDRRCDPWTVERLREALARP